MIAPSSRPSEQLTVPDLLPDAVVIQLLSTLEEMIQVHQHFLGLLQREKSLMIEGNIEDLNRLLGEKETILGRLNQLEQRRQKEIDPFSKQLRRNNGQGRFERNQPKPGQPEQAQVGQEQTEQKQILTLKRLMNHVSAPFQERLRSCHVRLEALTASVREINQINGILIDRTLHKISALLGLLRHLAIAPSTYESTGLLSDVPAHGRTIGKG